LPVVWRPAAVWGRWQQAWLRRASFHPLPLCCYCATASASHGTLGERERELIEAEEKRDHWPELIVFVFARVVPGRSAPHIDTTVWLLGLACIAVDAWLSLFCVLARVVQHWIQVMGSSLIPNAWTVTNCARTHRCCNLQCCALCHARDCLTIAGKNTGCIFPKRTLFLVKFSAKLVCSKWASAIRENFNNILHT
jgi:hypothetical protein